MVVDNNEDWCYDYVSDDRMIRFRRMRNTDMFHVESGFRKSSVWIWFPESFVHEIWVWETVHRIMGDMLNENYDPTFPPF